MTWGPIQLLRSYASAVRRVCGAETASLFIPRRTARPANPVLIHAGELPPVPELADVAAAEEFCERVKEESGASDSLLFRISSSSGDGRLVRIPTIQSILELTLPVDYAPRRHTRRRVDRQRDDRGADAGSPSWIGLRFSSPQARGAASFPLLAGKPASRWSWLLALGGALAWHAQQVSFILHDPVTGLPGRTELQASLEQAMERAVALQRPLTLLLINPEDFTVVNEGFGKEAGDRVLREVSDRLRTAVRDLDLVGKYGGAVFAAVLPDTTADDGTTVADKLLRVVTEAAYLDGAVRLRFIVGLACFNPAADSLEQPLDLIRRADQALNAAKRAGGGRIVRWWPGSESEEAGNLDRLSGIFTADSAKDYRNMVLLWDAMSIMAGSGDTGRLEVQVVEKLLRSFKPERVGLFRRSDRQGVELVHGLVRKSSLALDRVDDLLLSPEQRALTENALRKMQPEKTVVAGSATSAGEKSRIIACVIPLVVESQCLGCFYLDGAEEAWKLDSSDVVFLQALAGQLAVALDRARLAEQERRRLHSELKELRSALQQSNLVYQSAEMRSLLETVRRVGPTDATVLIVGESGTGKELLARTIHEVSLRHGRRFVVVDCSAIAASLIESELFGHEKGAYTGAQQEKAGLLAEAHGGTVLLDEIGELTLEAQSKLLRFVQEKQLTRVGGTRTHRVDVRVIAATNRDLDAEVAAGRFREDLYHRLNVVRLRVPPLRERAADILFLANYFLETSAVQYHKPVRRVTREAEKALLRHAWSGNVRELQNRIMQAVILHEGDEITPEQLGLATPPSVEVRTSAAAAVRVEKSVASASSAPRVETVAALRTALQREIEHSVAGTTPRPLPLGKWLDDDLVLEAYSAADGVLSRGATFLGIPETTFRRRHRLARRREETGVFSRTPEWKGVRAALRAFVLENGNSGENLFVRARELLLHEVSFRLPSDPGLASALMGVTVPTFRRWVEQPHTAN